MRNIKLTISYDGTRYHGWQSQQNAVTVQDVLETAILKITGARPRVTGCSRTDTGVHAQMFVCNFGTETTIPADKIPLAIKSYLPNDIICLKAEDTDPDFHSRYCAKKKRYTYYIQNSQFPDVFKVNYAWHFPYPLDIDAMQKAAKAFLGEHDFIGFMAGTLAFVGCGKIKADDMEDIINSCDRKRAGITAPPEGLFLTEVFY